MPFKIVQTFIISVSKAVVLTQVMRQAGQDPEQVRFRDILLRLRNAQVTIEDWHATFDDSLITYLCKLSLVDVQQLTVAVLFHVYKLAL